MSQDDYDMLNTFAHDLKNPIGGISNYLQMLEQMGDLTPQQAVYAKRIYENVDRALQMVNDFLEFSRLDASMTLKLTEIDLEALIKRILQELESHIVAKQLLVKVNVSPAVAFVQADERLIHHALVNLLSNAIKYNRQEGRIDVEVREESSFVRLSVQDTGMGIPENEQHRVFERFYRARASKQKHIEGTGLGLAIVRRVIEQHGGKVWVDSVVGEGATFTVLLPHLEREGHVREVVEVPLVHEASMSLDTHPQPSSEEIDALNDDSQESHELHDSDSQHDQR